MPFFGKVWTAGYGPTQPMILSIKAEDFGGGVLVTIKIRPEYTERAFAIFVNAAFLQVEWCGTSGEIKFMIPATPDAINSCFIEDIGRVTELSAETLEYIATHAKEDDALTANKILLKWDNVGKYSQTAVNGDGSLSSIVITGARRGINCTALASIKTRARLHYTIQDDEAGDHWVRWYDGTVLRAEGSRTGNGAVACASVDGTGLSIACTLVYGAAVQLGDAYIDLKWAKSYKVFYSTAAINYSGSVQGTVNDDQKEEFEFLSTARPAGAYYWNIVAVDDEGDSEAAPADRGPVDVNTLSDAPVITGVTQVSPYNFRVAFTADATASSHTIYHSHVNSPINFGDLADGPAPVVATTPTEDIVVAAFTPQDDETAYDTLVAALDAAVATANTAFGAAIDYATFGTDFDTLVADIEAAVDTFATAVKLPLFAAKDSLQAAGAQATSNLAAVDDDLWATVASIHYGNYLQAVGLLLNDDPQRYSLPDGSAAGTTSLTPTGTSLRATVLPFTKRNLVNIVMRSTKSGNEERNDLMYEIELDASGNLITPRPAKAFIKSYTLGTSGVNKTVTVIGGVVDDDFEEAAYLDLYVYSGSINLAAPTQSIALGDAVAGYKEATFAAVNITDDTWNYIAVVARTAAGTRGEFDETKDFKSVYNGVDTPLTAGNLEAFVVRGN